ncbi:cytochrome c family protein [Maridesulfovibrio hydrothermalis]|uniref:Cytochrome c family protein n=1 Tax=Maridesulfovibrio hydrothermalis AM13 = DSM 14728 TaxID=1121451 RepID=L0RDH3_9BACT|nr:cytochrome c family protein [Maridesulfovibrio hydrothermalis]CCO23611.1 Cytochrome c family protein [Maridesulfovibrio hydrothermalis AM13 = DSM 14728]
MRGKGFAVRIGVFLAALVVFGCSVADYGITDSAVYVGSESCKECHENEYSNYSKYSKKAHSARSVKLMATDLDPDELKECFACHATGYGKPGGFISFEETPHLADAGCEVCHGPGSLHAEDGDPELIKRKMTIEECETCHNAERVENFNFKPLIFGGAH